MKKLLIILSLIVPLSHADRYYEVEDIVIEALYSGTSPKELKKILKEKGLDINVKEAETGSPFLYRILEIYAENFVFESVRFSLDAGANPNAVNNENNTVLHLVTDFKCAGKSEDWLEEFKKLVLSLVTPENVDIKNSSGQTPFFKIISSGCKDEELLRALITSEDMMVSLEEAEREGNLVALDIIYEDLLAFRPYRPPGVAEVASQTEVTPELEVDDSFTQEEINLSAISLENSDGTLHRKYDELEVEVATKIEPSELEVEIDTVQPEPVESEVEVDTVQPEPSELEVEVDTVQTEPSELEVEVDTVQTEASDETAEEPSEPAPIEFSVKDFPDLFEKLSKEGGRVQFSNTCEKTGSTYTIFIPSKKDNPSRKCEIYLNGLSSASWYSVEDASFCAKKVLNEFSDEEKSCGNVPVFKVSPLELAN